MPNHTGQCRHLHGHTYTAEVTVMGAINPTPGASDEGMVVDFSHVKEALRLAVQEWDHRFLLSNSDILVQDMTYLPGVIVVPFVPTAENLARELLAKLPQNVCQVRLWETPTSFAEVWK